MRLARLFEIFRKKEKPENTITVEVGKPSENNGSLAVSDWKVSRMNEVEACRLQGKSLPFGILECKDKGFLAKVKGLYAYIPFHSMPWDYFDRSAWVAVAPYLIRKKFFCKIEQSNPDNFSIILNAKIPQFKGVELTIGDHYSGIIIKKSRYGLFVDIGFHFDWSSGSIVGLLHQSELDDEETGYREGEKLMVMYHGVNNDGKVSLKNIDSEVDWYSLEMQEKIGQTTWALVSRQEDCNRTNRVLVEGKYDAVLNIPVSQFPGDYQKSVNKAFRALSNNDIIHCKIIRYIYSNKTLLVNLTAEFEGERLVSIGLPEYVDDVAQPGFQVSGTTGDESR